MPAAAQPGRQPPPAVVARLVPATAAALTRAAHSLAFFERHRAGKIQVGSGVLLVALGGLVFLGELFRLNIAIGHGNDRLGLDLLVRGP